MTFDQKSDFSTWRGLATTSVYQPQGRREGHQPSDGYKGANHPYWVNRDELVQMQKITIHMPTTHMAVEKVTKNILQPSKLLLLALRKRLVCSLKIDVLQEESKTCGKMLDTEHHMGKLWRNSSLHKTWTALRGLMSGINMWAAWKKIWKGKIRHLYLTALNCATLTTAIGFDVNSDTNVQPYSPGCLSPKIDTFLNWGFKPDMTHS